MEKIFFSPTSLSFYPESFKSDYITGVGWPADAIRVTEDDWLKYVASPPSGKILGTGINNMPAWVDAPPPTAEENMSSATAKKLFLINEANNIIAPLKDALDGDYIDDTDKPKLEAWQKYRYVLTKVDVTKPVWPKKPE